MKLSLFITLSLLCYSIHAQDIFEAYKSKDYIKLEQLLEKGADPNQLDNSRKLPLMFDAAWDNNIKIMELLYKFGGQVDLEAGSSKVTPLLAACQQNSFEAAKFLVSKGANANRRFTEAGNQTPIRFACKTGNIDFISLLIDNGASIEDTPDDKITPLMQAAKSNHYALVEFLINKGANVNAYSRDKDTALSLAIISNHTKIVELLLRNGADATAIDNDGYSCLDLAKKTKNKKLIQMIKDKL